MPVVPFVPQKKAPSLPEVNPTFLAIVSAEMRKEKIVPPPAPVPPNGNK